MGAAGFKTFVYPSLTLKLNQRARVDAAMEIGNVSDKVTITAEAPNLQTDTTQVGSVINSTSGTSPILRWSRCTSIRNWPAI